VLAVDAACQASAYRADLLTEALPSTWDDVITLGQRARAQGRWVGLPLLPTDCICSFLTLCACLGDPPGVDEGTLLHDPAVGLRALELLKTLHAVGHPDALRWNPILMLNHMSSHHDLVYCPLTFTYSNYSRDGYVEKRVHYTNIPGVRGSILGGAGFAVSAHCRNVAEAVAYGMWICSADVQRTLYVERGGQPGNGVAWEDDHANAITHNFFRDTYDTLRAAYVRPRYNGYHVFQEEAGNLIHAMLRDSTGTQDCLAAVTRLYDETLRRGRG
jgi:multiple sugar transport system substrate-binding protein